MKSTKLNLLASFVIIISLWLWGSMAVQALVTSESLGFQTVATTQKPVSELITVKDFKVYDGDTADFILDRSDNVSIKARFLLIDAPEITGGVPYSKAARKRVNQLLNEARLIQIEYEGPEKDKYQRDLVHVWVDGHLLSEILVREGYAIARYIQDYLPASPYVPAIFQAQTQAKYEGLRVWVDGDLDFIRHAETEPQSLVTYGSTGEGEEEIYYRNCKEVQAAGKAPIKEGESGFRPQFDGDGDGVGCEFPD